MDRSLISQLLLLLLAVGTSATDDTIDTKLGTLRGWTGLSRDGREYTAFVKIPFAKPPVGDLRFKNPVAFGKWDGVMNATDDPPACYQYDSLNISGRGRIVWGSEDCLYLNIYVPKGLSKKVPVLFHIHGGAFQMGHPGGRHKAKFIMDEDVVLVATAYRLSLFGFLSLEDGVIPGNFGLKDQALALRWVKENIDSFGGDPERIVIFGESAGGASVHHLLNSPLTKDLISGAMSNSGTTPVWGTARPGKVKTATHRLASAVNCPAVASSMSSDDLLNCLQSVDSVAWDGPLKQFGAGMVFRPCVEPEGPGAVVLADHFNSTLSAPWIVSLANGEFLFSYFLQSQGNSQSRPKNFTEVIKHLVYDVGFRPSPATNEIIKRIEAKYRNGDKEIDVPLKYSLIIADVGFTFATLDALNRQPGTKYFGVFEHRGETSFVDSFKSRPLKTEKACHSDELLYLFDGSPRLNNSRMNEVDLKVSKEYIKLLTNFAYYKNPTPKGSTLEWKPWTKNEVLRITSKGSFMGDSEYYNRLNDVYTFWQDIIRLAGKSKI